MLFRCQKGLKMLPERWNNVLTMWDQGLRPWEMGLGDPKLRQDMVGRGWSDPHSSIKNVPPESDKKCPKVWLLHAPALSLAFLLKIAHTHTLAKTWACREAMVCMLGQFWARRSASESSHCPAHIDMHDFSLLSLAMVATQGSMLMYLAKI